MTAETFLPFKTPKMCLTPQFMELQSNDLGRLASGTDSQFQKINALRCIISSESA